MGQETSKPKQYTLTEHDRAMLQLKKSRDNIDKYSQSMFRKIGAERAQIKTIISTKKVNGQLSSVDEAKCKSILKRIRYQESLVGKAVQQLLSLEEMILSIDFKQVEMSFVSGLENGNSILKQLNEELTLERVDAVLDESEEQMAISNEINDVLGEQSNTAGQYLEQEVDLELQNMIQEIEGARETRTPEKVSAEKLPDVAHLPELEVRREEVVKEAVTEDRVLVPS